MKFKIPLASKNVCNCVIVFRYTH